MLKENEIDQLTHRIQWIDVLKGIGIILLVFSHLVPDGFVGDTSLDKSLVIGYLYSFHMPLFFFASGITFNYRKHTFFPRFVWSRVKSILIPYATLYACSLLYFGWMHWKGIVGVLDPMVVLKAFLYADGNHLGILNMSLWFLPCLFLAQILAYFPIKYAKDNNFILILSWFSISLIGAYLSKLDTHGLPWTAGAAINAASLIILGYLFKINEKWIVDKFRLNSRWVAILCLFLGVLVFLINGRPGMSGNYYGSYYSLFYIAVACSLVYYIYLSKKLANSKVLVYFGANSLVIFGLHGLILSFWKNVDFYSKFSNKFNVYLDGLSIVMLSTVLVVITCIPFIEFFNRVCPFLLGKSYSNKRAVKSHAGSIANKPK